jgi:putative membrane protein
MNSHRPTRHVAVMSAMLSVAAFGVAHADSLNPDKDFAMKAAQAGMAEIAEARIALKNSQRPDVQIFARRMIADHTKANEQLKTIAKEQGIELPNAPDDGDLMRMKQLGALAGKDFDNAYIQQEVKDHQAAVALFAQESDSGQNPQLKSFATTTLPTLKEHDKMANALPQH